MKATRAAFLVAAALLVASMSVAASRGIQETTISRTTSAVVRGAPLTQSVLPPEEPVFNNISVLLFNMSTNGKHVFKPLRPLVPSGSSVVFVAHADTLFALDVQTGKDLHPAFVNIATFASHPILCGYLVVLGDTIGQVIAIDARTNRKVWTQILEPGIPVTGDLSCSATAVFVNLGATLHMLAVATGQARQLNEADITVVPAVSSGRFSRKLGQTTAAGITTASEVITVNGHALCKYDSDSDFPRVVWKVDTGSTITQGPVVTMFSDGIRIHIVSGGSLLIYLDGESPQPICSVAVNDVITSTPIVSRVTGWTYLAKRNGDIIALNTECHTMWSLKSDWKSAVYARSLALASTGALAYAAGTGLGMLNGMTGQPLWSRHDGRTYHELSVGPDDIVYGVTGNGILHGVGMPEVYAANAYERSLMLAMARTPEKTAEAISTLATVCKASIAAGAMGLSSLAHTSKRSCRMLDNLQNNLDIVGTPSNHVNPLSYEEYYELLSTVKAEMKEVDEATQRLDALYQSNEDIVEEVQQQMKDNSDQLAADEAQVARDDTMVESYSEQLQANRAEAVAIAADIGQDVTQTLQDITSQVLILNRDIANMNDEIDKENKEIKVLKRKKLVQQILGVFLSIASTIVSVIPGLGAVVGAAASAAFTGGSAVASSYDPKCLDCRIKAAQEKIKADKASIQHDKDDIEDLAVEQKAILGVLGYVQALKDVDAAIENPTELSEFPDILPQLSIDELSESQVTAYLDMTKAAFAVDGAGDGGRQLFMQISKLTENAKLHISLIKTWFQMAMKRQDAEDVRALLQLRSHRLASQELHRTNRGRVLQDAITLQARRMCRLQQRSLQLISAMRAQFEFWSLTECIVQVPPPLLECPRVDFLHELPVSDITQVWKALEQFVDDMTANIEEEKKIRDESESFMTTQAVRFSVNSTEDPALFKQLQQTGSATVSINIPYSSVGGTVALATDMFNMRMHDVRVMVDGASLAAHEHISLSVQHGGFSQILDKFGRVHKFTHVSRPQPYTYYTQNNCPATCACTYFDGKPDPDNLGLCPDFINYSPYGTWHVDLSQSGIDFSGVDRIRFHFVVYAQRFNNDFRMRLFANDQTQQDPPPLGEYCNSGCR